MISFANLSKGVESALLYNLIMKITWDDLLSRIESDPLEHLGASSPRLLWSYFFGYEHALSFHSHPDIEGEMGLGEFNRWFVANAYAGPQGWASYCELITNSSEKALELFYEFRRIAKDSNWKEDDPFAGRVRIKEVSFLELIRSDALNKRPAMYFGNSEWLSGLWAMWSGYVWAENDIGVTESVDRDTFVGFQGWLQQRFEFAQTANFGKLFDFLALDVKENALESFFDHLDLFLEGGQPDANTKRFQGFLDEAVAAALKEQER